MDYFLPDPDVTRSFGRCIARALADGPRVPVFFHGELGAGKTTLISSLVRALPGGASAETSSPSFTLCNIYATLPPVAHFDLYRQENGSADESLLDFLDGERHLVLVEWAERLPDYALPPERLRCEMRPEKTGRRVRLAAFGTLAERLADAIDAAWTSHAVFSRETP